MSAMVEGSFSDGFFVTTKSWGADVRAGVTAPRRASAGFGALVGVGVADADVLDG